MKLAEAIHRMSGVDISDTIPCAPPVEAEHSRVEQVRRFAEAFVPPLYRGRAKETLLRMLQRAEAEGCGGKKRR